MRLTFRLAVMASVALCAFASPLSAAVFINEIHYDDSTGTGDVGERVEVIATEGENLANYTLTLYNGSGGAPYTATGAAVTAPASITCGSGTASVVVFTEPGLQNGAPDGIALVGPSNAVVQFLSYEGSFTASGGPANGMTSTDIGVAETNSTAPGTSLQLTGNGNAYAQFTWANSGTDNFGACNTGQTFTPTVDVPPTVSSTTPANGATGVSTVANVLVNFSEPVTASGAWFTLTCATSGAHTATVSGGPANYTLNPDTDFASGESCTVTLVAAQIADQDGTADNLAANYVFSFQTAPDTAPAVASTTPANNASNVPVTGNIAINFNEAVTASGTWATVSCGTTGAHPVGFSGTGANYVLDPTTDFGFSETCTVTVLAAQIADQDGVADNMAANYVFTFTTAVGTGDYYASVDATNANTLRTTLHNLIKDHVSYPYSGSGTDTWTILEAADQDPSNPSRILDVYKNAVFPKAGGGNTNYNREHTWPNSLGFPNTDANGLPNPPYTDCHMLYLSHIGYNSDRGNKPYANCSGCTERATDANSGFGGGSGTYPGNSNWFQGPDGNGGSFEAWNHRKGDVARAVMYMVVRYEGGTNAAGQLEPDLELTDTRSQITIVNAQITGGVAYMGLKSTLIAWHEQDPPDAQEVLRNDVVQSFQQNRNPFVDHPEWVACLFGNVCTNTPTEAVFQNGFE